jgi:hypothetical protein
MTIRPSLSPMGHRGRPAQLYRSGLLAAYLHPPPPRGRARRTRQSTPLPATDAARNTGAEHRRSEPIGQSERSEVATSLRRDRVVALQLQTEQAHRNAGHAPPRSWSANTITEADKKTSPDRRRSCRSQQAPRCGPRCNARQRPNYGLGDNAPIDPARPDAAGCGARRLIRPRARRAAINRALSAPPDRDHPIRPELAIGPGGGLTRWVRPDDNLMSRCAGLTA